MPHYLVHIACIISTIFEQTQHSKTDYILCMRSLGHPYIADDRGTGAGPAGTVAVGPMLEAKLMNLIKGRLQKF